MNDLIAALGVVYACNSWAEQAPVASDLALQCVRAHETVKQYFLTEDEINQLAHLSFKEQTEVKLEGYRRFKTWELANPDLVRDIQDASPARRPAQNTIPVF